MVPDDDSFIMVKGKYYNLNCSMKLVAVSWAEAASKVPRAMRGQEEMKHNKIVLGSLC
jgi:hypothetical protein